MPKVKGRVLITGGARRIGRQIAITLAEAGYDIIVHYNRSREAAARLAGVIQKLGRRCDLCSSDLTLEAATRQMLPDIKKKFGKVDVLINNASIFRPDSLTDVTSDLWKESLGINFIAPYILTGTFARFFHSGHIINILDTNISKHATRYFSYLLAKKALAELTRMAAVNLAPKVRVNGVAPGWILPPEGQSKARQLKAVRELVPLQRAGSPGDVAAAVMYLISNPFLNGEIVYVDGGQQYR